VNGVTSSRRSMVLTFGKKYRVEQFKSFFKRLQNIRLTAVRPVQ